MIQRWMVLVVVAGVVAATSGCASVSQPDDEFAPGNLDMLTAYDAAADWLPADSLVVAAAVGEPGWEQWQGEMLPTAIPDAEPGEVGTAEGLEQELREEYVAMLGFDPMDSHAAAVGVTEEGFTAVIFGVDDRPAELEEIEVGDEKVFVLESSDLSGMPAVQQVLDMSVYLFPVDAPANMMVVTTQREWLEAVVDSDQTGPSLAAADNGEQYRRLFAESSEATAAAVSPWSSVLGEVAAGEPIPDVVRMTVDDEQVGLVAEGEPEVLAQLDEYVQQALRNWSQPIDEALGADEGWKGLDTLLIYGRHGMASIAGQLEDSVYDDRLEYTVSRSGASLMGLVTTVALTGASAGYALYIQRTREFRDLMDQDDQFIHEIDVDEQPPLKEVPPEAHIETEPVVEDGAGD